MANKSKRKNDFMDIKTEPAMKALKKQDLLLQYKALQASYEKLILENEKQLEAIALLEETVQLLENKNARKSSNVASVQTEDLERLWCIECEYPAEDHYDLGEHMYEVHAEENPEYTISCHYCGNCFKSKDDLMIHNKKNHSEKIQPCRNFLEGKCDFSDINCWFSHDTKNKNLSQVYMCSICKKTFKIRSDLMQHRKHEHMETVSKCKNEGTCKFGNTKCWYIHSEQIEIEYEKERENKTIKKEEMMEKLFTMVEKVTERMFLLEKQFESK